LQRAYRAIYLARKYSTGDTLENPNAGLPSEQRAITELPFDFRWPVCQGADSRRLPPNTRLYSTRASFGSDGMRHCHPQQEKPT
jgi:hypothetical protein